MIDEHENIYIEYIVELYRSGGSIVFSPEEEKQKFIELDDCRKQFIEAVINKSEYLEYYLSILNNIIVEKDLFQKYFVSVHHNRIKNIGYVNLIHSFLSQHLEEIKQAVKNNDIKKIKKLLYILKPSTKLIYDFAKKFSELQFIYDKYKNIFDSIVIHNLKLVLTQIKSYDSGSLQMNDLIQEGNIGLIKAVEKFDIKKETKFSTYASWWIKFYILRSLANKKDIIRIPVYLYTVLNVLYNNVGIIDDIKDIDKETLKEISKKYNIVLEHLMQAISCLDVKVISDNLFISEQYSNENIEYLYFYQLFDKKIINILTNKELALLFDVLIFNKTANINENSFINIIKKLKQKTKGGTYGRKTRSNN